ncbi:hypothetical protein DH2020_040847 [Rehmannia glutinosa]|uniref:RING-type E3 ubiquitin transferase n=1 Tax=Rehmannia glutinosa TaxID=99300 RepID=A0ABR0URU6_REHGL
MKILVGVLHRIGLKDVNKSKLKRKQSENASTFANTKKRQAQQPNSSNKFDIFGDFFPDLEGSRSLAVAEESEVESETDNSLSDSSSGSEGEAEEQGIELVGRPGAVVDLTRNGDGGGSDSERSKNPRTATLMDLDVLDCPICCEPLCSPVYQCENGHIACASCCTKMWNKCANCRRPIGYNRCRVIEKVLESVKVLCPNIQHGCMETLTYNKKLDHEKTCNYVPCSCPHSSCNYVGMSKCLYTHFARVHAQSSRQFVLDTVVSISMDNNQMQVFLQERSQSTLFILNRAIMSLGSFVNVVCIAPISSKGAFLYDLTAIVGDTSIKIKTGVECMPKWTVQALTKKCLIVPRDFIRARGQLKFDLIIRKNPAVAR